MFRVLLLIVGIIALFGWFLVGFASIPKFGFYLLLAVVCFGIWKMLNHISKTQKEA